MKARGHFSKTTFCPYRLILLKKILLPNNLFINYIFHFFFAFIFTLVKIQILIVTNMSIVHRTYNFYIMWNRLSIHSEHIEPSLNQLKKTCHNFGKSRVGTCAAEVAGTADSPTCVKSRWTPADLVFGTCDNVIKSTYNVAASSKNLDLSRKDL